MVALSGLAGLSDAVRVEHYRPPTWPDPDVPKQIHLDLAAGEEFDDAQARAVALGAQPATEQPDPDRWRVLLDPAGHPFCITTVRHPSTPREQRAWTTCHAGGSMNRCDHLERIANGPGRLATALPLRITVVGVTLLCMPVERFSVTMDPALGEAVRTAAARTGTSVSGWLAQAAADRLRNDLLGAALDAWEAEEGPFDDVELKAAASALGISREAAA